MAGSMHVFVYTRANIQTNEHRETVRKILTRLTPTFIWMDVIFVYFLNKKKKKKMTTECIMKDEINNEDEVRRRRKKK